MCLDIITKADGFDPEKEVIAYKVFELVQENDFPPNFPVEPLIKTELISPNFGRRYFKIGKWINEKSYRCKYFDEDLLVGGGGNLYKTGFHVFKNKVDAKEYKRLLDKIDKNSRRVYCVLKVKIRKIVAEGTQKFKLFPNEPLEVQVIVAKEMFIMEGE
jgi:hypothetical protein